MITIKLTAEKLSRGQFVINPAVMVSKQEKGKFTVEFGWIATVLGIEISWKNGKE